MSRRCSIRSDCSLLILFLINDAQVYLQTDAEDRKVGHDNGSINANTITLFCCIASVQIFLRLGSGVYWDGYAGRYCEVMLQQQRNERSGMGGNLFGRGGVRSGLLTITCCATRVQ